MVEVFKTDVREISQAEKLLRLLSAYFPQSKINFDLEDCDKILRIDSHTNISDDAIFALRRQGFKCEELE